MTKNRLRLTKVWRIIIIVVLLLLISQIPMTKIIYDAVFPRYDVEDWGEFSNQIQGLLDTRELVTFASGENVLQGYYYGSPQEADALVVIAPGLNAGADDYLNQIAYFLDYGYDVFTFDSTGSCKSEGESAVGFSQELWDLDAALDYVEESYAYEHVFLFGHSRGGYSVCGMLDREHDITAVASVSGLNSAMEAVIGLSTRYVGAVAYANYPLLWLYQTILFDVQTVQTDASEEINSSDIPVMIIQGTEDDVAPMEQFSIYSHKDEITSSHVEYYLCDEPGQNGHTDLLYEEDGTANDALMEAVCQFYQKSVMDLE